MNESEITALAREYAELTDGSPADKSYITAIAENTIRFLLRRYVLVEKSKATGLCRLTLEHGDSVDYGLIDGLTDIVCDLFSEQYEQEASNPEIAKEVEEIEKASKEFAKSIIDSFGCNGVPCGISDIRLMIADGFKSGAFFTLFWRERKEKINE